MKSLVGKVLQDHYYVVRELAQKNYEITYLAEDKIAPIKTFYILKRLGSPTKERVLTKQFWDNLQQLLTTELLNLKRVDRHPKITEIIDFFTIDREFYLVREYIEGKTLQEEVTNRTLNEKEVTFLLKEILECLDFIHQENIYHLNLKPSNIIRRQEDGKIFITDFGKIQKLAQNVNFKQILPNNNPLTTQVFIAPEQKQGFPNNTSDIYSLGQIALYFLSGQKTNRIEINNLDNYARASIIELTTSRVISISSKLANILSKMTSEAYEDRYQSAKEILQDLEEEENVVVLPPPFAINDYYSEETPQPEAPPSVTHKKNRRKRSLWQIIMWILVAIPFMIALWVFNIGINKNKYKNFLEYVNDPYDVTLKYPDNWSFIELEDPITGGVAVFYAPLEDGFDLFQEKIYLSIDELSSPNANLETYSQNILDRIKSQLTSQTLVHQEVNKKVDGNDAHTFIYSRKEGIFALKQMEIVTIKGDRAYIMTYIAEETKYNKFLPQAEKIIDSFTVKE